MKGCEGVTLRGRIVTREDVLLAIDTYQTLGLACGYKPAKRYHLRHAGKLYPSKAILGAAAGLDASQFFGGVAETVELLNRLGFKVLDIERDEETVELEAIRAAMVEEGFDNPAPPWPELPVVPAAYFLSGSNRAEEIAALAAAGADVGVCALELTGKAGRALMDLAGSDVAVFVDSGAFGRDLTPDDWRQVLLRYHSLAEVLGPQLAVVAPDVVGDQPATLELLKRHALPLKMIRALGAQVFVPVQKGTNPQASFARLVDAALGFTSWVPAIPCKRAATTPEELAEFVAERKPAHVHLLGLGVRNPKAAEYLEAFVDSSAGVSLDSCWIAASVGRGGRKPRRLTLARDIAGKVLRAAKRFTHALRSKAAIFTCLTAEGGAS